MCKMHICTVNWEMMNSFSALSKTGAMMDAIHSSDACTVKEKGQPETMWPRNVAHVLK